MCKIQQKQLTSNWLKTADILCVSDEPNKIGPFHSFIWAEKQIQFSKHVNKLRYNYSYACV
jgi:hypothetical protein